MDESDSYMKLIDQRLDALQLQLDDVTGGAATVELDQSRVGRLSRMEALQAQAMHTESLARAKRQLIALQHAKRRIQNDEFGLCLQCDEDIASARLQLDPSVTLCITCAEKKERGC